MSKRRKHQSPAKLPAPIAGLIIVAVLLGTVVRSEIKVLNHFADADVTHRA
jgi:hypothetical protein